MYNKKTIYMKNYEQENSGDNLYEESMVLNENTTNLNSLLTSAVRNKEEIIQTGYSEFDDKFQGFKLGELIAIGGRIALGKTQLLISLSLNISHSLPVLFLSYDLGKEKIAKRYISSLLKIRVSEVADNINKNESLLKKIDNQIQDRKIFINEISSTDNLKDYLKQQVELNGIKVVMIDDFQNLTRIENNRVNQKDRIITNELKQIAKELNICINITTQLSRDVEYRGGYRRPELHDILDNGNIEIDADKVLLIYRPSYYGFMEDENGNDWQNVFEIIVVKNKNGSTGIVKLKYDTGFMSIE